MKTPWYWRPKSQVISAVYQMVMEEVRTQWWRCRSAPSLSLAGWISSAATGSTSSAVLFWWGSWCSPRCRLGSHTVWLGWLGLGSSWNTNTLRQPSAAPSWSTLHYLGSNSGRDTSLVLSRVSFSFLDIHSTMSAMWVYHITKGSCVEGKEEGGQDWALVSVLFGTVHCQLIWCFPYIAAPRILLGIYLEHIS